MPRKTPPHDDPPLDLYDYENKFKPRLPSGPRPSVPLRVEDDWPRDVPIGWREIQVTEAYLEKVLAELLGPLP
jgi:hypothetical protein